jgi:hypothetical protein
MASAGLVNMLGSGNVQQWHSAGEGKYACTTLLMEQQKSNCAWQLTKQPTHVAAATGMAPASPQAALPAR